jgi:hypothetical protein
MNDPRPTQHKSQFNQAQPMALPSPGSRVQPSPLSSLAHVHPSAWLSQSMASELTTSSAMARSAYKQKSTAQLSRAQPTAWPPQPRPWQAHGQPSTLRSHASQWTGQSTDSLVHGQTNPYPAQTTARTDHSKTSPTQPSPLSAQPSPWQDQTSRAQSNPAQTSPAHSKPNRWPAQPMTSLAHDPSTWGVQTDAYPIHGQTAIEQHSPWPDSSMANQLMASLAQGQNSTCPVQPMASLAHGQTSQWAAQTMGSPTHTHLIPLPAHPMATAGHGHPSP